MHSNNAKKIKIAIDGLSGCGKSTLAKALSRKYGLLYIDSGALYCLTAYLLNRYYDITEKDMGFLYEIEMLQDGDILWRGRSYASEIGYSAVKDIVSYVAQNSIVRKKINEWIQNQARDASVVIDGRDIGSVVLPDAEVKVYIYSSIDYRINNWRINQIKKYGVINLEMERVERENLEKRDYNDLHREIAPLVCAKDAVSFDLEQYGIDKIFYMVSSIVESKLIDDGD